MGTFNARQLKAKRKKAKYSKRGHKIKVFGLKKKMDPLKGAPQAKGLVLSKRQLEQKQPHSGMIKAVRVKLIKNGKEVTVHLPRDKAISHVQEHDEVTIEGIGGSQGKSVGSIPGVRYRVCAVNGIDIKMLRTGKKQRASR